MSPNTYLFVPTPRARQSCGFIAGRLPGMAASKPFESREGDERMR